MQPEPKGLNPSPDKTLQLLTPQLGTATVRKPSLQELVNSSIAGPPLGHSLLGKMATEGELPGLQASKGILEEGLGFIGFLSTTYRMWLGVLAAPGFKGTRVCF